MQIRTTGRGIGRRAAVLGLAVLAVLGAACAPPPSSTLTPVDLFEGGTYPVEIDVAPQAVTTEFGLFGLVRCAATTTTPSIDIDGTLTVTPAEISPGLDRVTIPGATLELPGSRVSVGSLSLSCDGEHVGTAGVTIEFDATASVGAAVLDLDAGSLSLADPTVSITDALATFAGGPVGDTVVELDPILVTVPTVSVDV